MFITVPYFVVGGNATDHSPLAQFSDPDKAFAVGSISTKIIVREHGLPPKQIIAKVSYDTVNQPVLAALPCPIYCGDDGQLKNHQFVDAPTDPQIQALMP